MFAVISQGTLETSNQLGDGSHPLVPRSFWKGDKEERRGPISSPSSNSAIGGCGSRA